MLELCEDRRLILRENAVLTGLKLQIGCQIGHTLRNDIKIAEIITTKSLTMKHSAIFGAYLKEPDLRGGG